MTLRPSVGSMPSTAAIAACRESVKGVRISATSLKATTMISAALPLKTPPPWRASIRSIADALAN